MRKLKECRGDFTINGAFILILSIMLLVLAIGVLGIGMQAMKLNAITHEVVRSIELRGKVDDSAQALLEKIKVENNMSEIQMKIEASYTAGGNRIQFGDAFFVTLTYSGKLSVGGVMDVSIPLRSTVTGRSEVYWK